MFAFFHPGLLTNARPLGICKHWHLLFLGCLLFSNVLGTPLQFWNPIQVLSFMKAAFNRYFKNSYQLFMRMWNSIKVIAFLLDDKSHYTVSQDTCDDCFYPLSTSTQSFIGAAVSFFVCPLCVFSTLSVPPGGDEGWAEKAAEWS